MIWFKVIISIFFFLALQLNAINSLLPDYERAVELNCVKDKSDKSFEHFEINYHKNMSTNTYKFDNESMDEIKYMIGNNEKITLFFVGYEDRVRNPKGRSFQVAKAQSEINNAASCVVTYKYVDIKGLKYPQYFHSVGKRIPKVVEMMVAFVQNLIESIEIKIKSLDSVYLMGFCLGGHIASNVGYELKQIYPDKLAGAVWAFDPPAIGFPLIINPLNSRRAQKGDAKIVIVFHTSTLGVKEYLADIDIIVNGGQYQPDCNLSENGRTACSHFAAFILRELIVRTDLLEKEMNSDLSGILRRKGHPLVFKTESCAEFKNVHDKACEFGELFPIVYTNPPTDQWGIYHMHTGAVFETPPNTEEEQTFEQFDNETIQENPNSIPIHKKEVKV